MKIALIIAFENFRDEEYFIPKDVFEKNGAKVKTFSSSLGKAIGKFGGEAKADFLLEDLDVDNFDAIVFAGGPGAKQYIEDERCLEIAREAEKMGKVLGAICIAPLILSAAGVLKGKRATVWSSSLDKSAINILEASGAVYEDKRVVVEDKIITGSGPEAAESFAKTIMELL